MGTDVTTSDGSSVYKLAAVDVFQLHAHPIMLPDDTGVYDVVFYLYDNAGYLTIYAEVDGKEIFLPAFVPLWYNQTKGCLVGYALEFDDGTMTSGSYVLQELYYNPVGQSIDPIEANPADYGL